MSMHKQNLVQLHQYILKILCGNDILTTFGMTIFVTIDSNNPKLDLVDIHVYAKSGLIPSICSQYNERKTNSNDYQGPLLCCKFAKTDTLQSL